MKIACPITKRVIEKMLRRAEAGMNKYGVTLERSDYLYIDWLKELQEELLDAAVYIEAAIHRLTSDI